MSSFLDGTVHELEWNYSCMEANKRGHRRTGMPFIIPRLSQLVFHGHDSFGSGEGMVINLQNFMVGGGTQWVVFKESNC